MHPIDIPVQRYLLKAVPEKDHSKYFPWQIATLCIMIADINKDVAFTAAKQLIKANKWIPISGIHKSTIIDELMHQQDKATVDEYLKIKSGKKSLLVFTDNWCGYKNSPPLLFPKITEAFMDNVFITSGGKRVVYDEKTKKRNADYILDDFIFELKIIEEERLLQTSVQNKISEFYTDNSNDEI